MKMVQVPGRQSLPVYRVDGYSRKFVRFGALARKFATSQKDIWFRFCELNTTEFWRYVPWVVVRANERTLTIDVEVPLWGAEPCDEDFLSGAVYVDANWAWDVLTLHELGVRSVSGSKHFHGRWQRSPCRNGNFACLWKEINRRSRSGIYGFAAIFAHGESGCEIIEVPESVRWYQPVPRPRPRKGSCIPEGEVLGKPLRVPASSS